MVTERQLTRSHQPALDLSDRAEAKDGYKKDDKAPIKTIGDPEAVYDYRDSNGVLLFQNCRFKTDTPPPDDKAFKYRRPLVPGEKPVWDIKGIKRVLYHLPELLHSRDTTVYLCEGEKDTDAVIHRFQFTATTNPLGAGKGKWLDKYNTYLEDKDVVILEDNDDTGRAHSKEVAQSLFRKAKSIKILRLPDLPEHGDFVDWYNREFGNSTVEQVKEKFLQLVEATPVLTEKDLQKWGEGKSLIEILDAPIILPNYLVEPILSAGDKGFLVAQYKKGKTLLMMDLTLSLSMGRDWLGFKVSKPRKVLYIRFELKDQRFHERLRLMTDGMGGREEIQSIPFFEYPRGFEITKQPDFDWLKRKIDIHEPEALLLDPFYKITSVLDIKDPKNAMPLLRKFEELRGAYEELLILFSHHDKKLNGTESGWDSAYGPMFFFADMDFEMKLLGGDGKFTLSFLSNDVPVEDIRIERNPETLVHSFVGTASQNLRKEIMDILRDEPSLPKASTVEGTTTIASLLKEKGIRFSSDKLGDELESGMKEGLYRMEKVTLTKSNGRTYRVNGYGLGI